MIQSVQVLATNGALLATVKPLWFPDYQTGEWVDLTYSKGGWWANMDPPKYLNDIDRDADAELHEDYRLLTKWEDGSLDGVFFDPPYAPPGGRETSTVKAMHAAYGMSAMPATPKATFLDHRRGLMAIGRVLKRDGRCVMKASDFITSGRYWSGQQNAVDGAQAAGMRLEDLVVHLSGPGPQPKTRKMKCPRCLGMGTLNVLLSNPQRHPCPMCNETGKVEQETREQHTRRVHSVLMLFIKERWA